MTPAPNTSCCEKCWVFNAAYSPKLGWCGNPTCECHTAHQSSQEAGHGYCIECTLETYPRMKCKCAFRQSSHSKCICEDDNKLTQAFCPVHGAPAYRKGESWEVEFIKCGKNGKIDVQAAIVIARKLLSEREEEAYRRGVVENVITLDDKLMKAFKDAREGDPLHKILQERFAAGAEAERATWINQPGNVHDERIREAERERILAVIEKTWDDAEKPFDMHTLRSLLSPNQTTE